jgi:putative transposase
LYLVADTSLSGLLVTRELDAIIATRGRALSYVSDSGAGIPIPIMAQVCDKS